MWSEYVNIVPHSGAVLRGVIIAEDSQLGSLPHHNLRHIRHQVVRDAVRIFSWRNVTCIINRIQYRSVRTDEIPLG